mgnify:CR=1 FL=1
MVPFLLSGHLKLWCCLGQDEKESYPESWWLQWGPFSSLTPAAFAPVAGRSMIDTYTYRPLTTWRAIPDIESLILSLDGWLWTSAMADTTHRTGWCMASMVPRLCSIRLLRLAVSGSYQVTPSHLWFHILQFNSHFPLFLVAVNLCGVSRLDVQPLPTATSL